MCLSANSRHHTRNAADEACLAAAPEAELDALTISGSVFIASRDHMCVEGTGSNGVWRCRYAQGGKTGSMGNDDAARMHHSSMTDLVGGCCGQCGVECHLASEV